MKAQLRQKAIELRVRYRLSYSEIQKKLHVSKSALSYWLRKHPLSEAEIVELRQKAWLKGAASRECFRNVMLKKREKRHGTCSIIFASVEKKREIMMAIKAFLDLYQKMRV
jgi:DNA-binding transcriptional ArsR family regulator